MGQIPDDIKERIMKLSEASKIPAKELVARLKEIMTTDETILTMEKEDFKIRYAWSILYREHSVVGNAAEFYIRPLCTPRVREVKLKDGPALVGDVVAQLQKITRDIAGQEVVEKSIYGAGTFWRDGAKNAQKMETGKIYRASIIAKENKWGVNISSDRANFSPVEYKMESFKQFYDEKIKPLKPQIFIGEMDMNKSDFNTHLRVFEATVLEASVGEKNGREYGRYLVMDDSVMEKMGNFAIFVDPKDVVWSQASVLLFGGTVDADTKTGELRWNNHFILPTEGAEPLRTTIKPSKKAEEVDVFGDEEKPAPTKAVAKTADKIDEEVDFST